MDSERSWHMLCQDKDDAYHSRHRLQASLLCRGLIRATLHMVNREFQALANDFETLGLLPAGSDKDRVVPALSTVFEKALAGGVSNMSFGTLSGELGKTM